MKILKDFQREFSGVMIFFPYKMTLEFNYCKVMSNMDKLQLFKNHKHIHIYVQTLILGRKNILIKIFCVIMKKASLLPAVAVPSGIYSVSH